MRAKTQDGNKNSFTERPHENEKKHALEYIEKLLEEARLDPTNRSEDIAELTEIHRLLNTKKYGLVWEDHAERVEEEMKTKIPVFVEDESKKISDNPDEDSYNFLLEGDNLHSLHLLEKAYAGKIDVIYIDPPYNTGNKDFVYNDMTVDKTDSFSHSKWLSFMERRLAISKTLLSEDGVIFISIDDNEQSQLRLLMDEIFGENNFITTFAWEKKKKPSFLNSTVGSKFEYILVFARNRSKTKAFSIEKTTVGKKYPFNNAGNAASELVFPKGSVKFLRMADQIVKKQDMSKGNIKTELLEDFKIKDGVNAEEIHLFGEWRYSQAKLNEFVADGSEITISTIPFRPNLTKVGGETKKMHNLLTVEQYNVATNEDASNELVAILGNNKFNFPKPSKLIKMLVQSYTYDNNNAVILDFFAGSGTTGQAVIELNAEDGGNRKFILATNNENNIAEEVTYERMKRVSAGTEKYKAHPMNLKYFKTAMINKEDENLEKTLLSNVKTLIELQHGVDLSNSKIAVVVNRKEAEELSVTGLSTVYMRGLTHQMLDEELAIKFSDVKIIDIPETYFPLELKEAGF